ncbi:MAG: hypothetical protein QHI38_11795 [Armatimonadota bacterium]|nr:hypothetical protein [Armatimonadota bacterium]
MSRALRRGFAAAYDHLGYVVLVSFLGFAATVAVLAGGMRLAMVSKNELLRFVLCIPAALTAWLAAVGAFYYAKKSVYHEYPSPGETLAGIRILLLPALALFAVNLVAAVVLIGDAVAYLLVWRVSAVYKILSIVCAYLAVFWILAAVYQLPLLAAQLDMPSGPKPLVVLKKSFLLFGDNPGFTVALFVVIIALAVVCALPGFVGMALFFLGTSAFVVTHAVRELFIKYGIVEDEPEVVEDKGWPPGD